MNNIFDYELYGDILRSPSSLEVGNENTTAKQMMADRKKLSMIIEEQEKLNKLYNENNITIEEYTKKVNELTNKINNLKDYYIPDESISIKKLDKNIMGDIKLLIQEVIHDENSIVKFDIEKGYLVAYVACISELNFIEENGNLYMLK